MLFKRITEKAEKWKMIHRCLARTIGQTDVMLLSMIGNTVEEAIEDELSSRHGQFEGCIGHRNEVLHVKLRDLA